MTDPIHLSKFQKLLPTGAEWILNPRDWLLVQLAEGAAYVLAGDTKKEFAPSEALLCPPHATVKILASVLGDASFRGLAICIHSLTGLLSASERRCLENDAPRQLAPFAALAADHPLTARLTQVFNEDENSSLPQRLAVVQSFAEFLAPQLRHAGLKETTAARADKDARSRLVRLMNEMPESEWLNLSLDQFARRIHSCERHASRLFQKVWGESFRSYVSDLRLKKACQLLAEGNAKIIDVALESGHGSLAHFNYVFKKQRRMTPTEWRDRRLKGHPTPAPGKSEKPAKIRAKVKVATDSRMLLNTFGSIPQPQLVSAPLAAA